MAKLVTSINNLQQSVLAMTYADGSLAIECSYFAHSEDETTLFHKLEISPEGVKTLTDMLVRATELRNEAEAGEHTCPSCAGTGITHSGMKFFNCAECNGTGHV